MAASDSQKDPVELIEVSVLLPVNFHARLCVMAEHRGMDQAEYIGKLIELGAQVMGLA